MRELKNECGSFWVDDAGVLRRFDCADSNLWRPLGEATAPNEKEINVLNIPEGVTALPAGAFDGYTVWLDISLPHTLTALGDGTGGVFRGSQLGELRMPEKLAYLAADSFFAGSLSRILLPEGMEAGMIRECIRLFQNQTANFYLSYPVEKVREVPEPQVPLRELKSESGRFWVDALGVLQRFACDYDNELSDASSYARRVYHLHIPEGVTALREDAFRSYDVLWELTLPDSLKILGTGHGGAFAGSRLPEVRLSQSLKVLGTYAFGCSCIHDLYLPERMPWPYARHFKGACIGRLHISRRYQEETVARELGPGVWGSLKCNGVKIGQFVWED